MNEPKITVFQYMHGKQQYFAWSEKVNQLYCRRHGYAYKVVRDTPRKDRHVNWHKVEVLHRECCNSQSDYILYLDADAVFYSHALRIEDELTTLMCGKKVLMAQDVGCETQRWAVGAPNAGVILLKPDDSVLCMLDEWNKSSDVNEKARWSWPLEQITLRELIVPAHRDLVCVHPEYYQIQGMYGQYIRHFMLMSDEMRTENIKKIYDRCRARS